MSLSSYPIQDQNFWINLYNLTKHIVFQTEWKEKERIEGNSS